MTSRDDIGRTNLFRRRSHREISRRRVHYFFFFFSIFIYHRQIIVERVYIYYDYWFDYIIYTHAYTSVKKYMTSGHVRFFDEDF